MGLEGGRDETILHGQYIEGSAVCGVLFRRSAAGHVLTSVQELDRRPEGAWRIRGSGRIHRLLDLHGGRSAIWQLN